jgi:hypothetical protein
VSDPPRSLAISSVAHHRNGISGEPFVAVVFTDLDEGQRMVATIGYRLNKEGDDTELNPSDTRVLDIDMLDDGDVRFGHNSWRGDNYGWGLVEEVERLLAEERDAFYRKVAEGSVPKPEVFILVGEETR